MQSNERVLIADTATMFDCKFVFRGTQNDLLTNPGKYVDLAANWNGAGNDRGNSVTLIKSDQANGVLELDGLTAY